MEKLNFYDFTLGDLEELFISRGEKKFRAAQLFKWVYQFKVTDFDEMTNLSKTARESYKEWFSFELPKVIHKQVSVDGTRKMLLDVGEGRSVEAVIIPAADRNTLCVSSEVGCNLGCTFCYTGTQKLKKRLSAGEIVGQFLRAQEFLGDTGKVTNIVYMGMGEPLDNCDSVFKSISILQCTSGISLSRRKITVSTSGLVDKIPLVAKSGVHLAVSLNGSNDQIRSEIMPINKKWPLKDLLNACIEYSEETNNKVTMEYILLKDKTDSIQDARALHRLTSNVPCKINVIPFNEHPASDFRRPSEKTIQAFQNELLRAGSQAFRRKTMGKDILAACGQLADVKQEASK